MICAGIVAEYNPFHNGHQYHIEQTRSKGATHIVAVMSGNFTQRGQGAVIPKAQRVKSALQCGVDLVIELPCVYSLGSAEKFAFSSVSLLNALGCVDMLSFGSESGDIDTLRSVTKALNSEQFSAALRSHLSSGISFPLARQRALEQLGSNMQLLPNDTLAIEYIRNLDRINSNISPIAVTRSGAMHDSQTATEHNASASYIRGLLSSNIDSSTKSELNRLMPPSSAEMLLQCIKGGSIYDENNASRSVLTMLRSLDKQDLLQLPDVSEGLENRIISALKTAQNLDQLYSLIKSKRYTHARIRRIVMCAYLGITSQLQCSPVPYIRILGANQKGREILSVAGKTASLPILGTMAAINSLPKAAQDIFKLECHAADLYGMMTKSILPCDMEQHMGVINI